MTAYLLQLARTDAGYAKGISVRALMKQYNLMDLSTYQHGARHAINMQRLEAAPVRLHDLYHTSSGCLSGFFSSVSSLAQSLACVAPNK